MRSHKYVLIVTLAISFAGCGPSVPSEVQGPQAVERDAPPARIAVDEKRPASTDSHDGPPHVFSPKSHPARYRYESTGDLDLKSLPPLKIRYNKCFGKRSGGGKAQIAVSGGSGAGGGGGGGGYAVKPKKKPSAPRPATPDPSQPSAATPLAGADGEPAKSASRSESFDAVEAEAAPAAEPSFAPSADSAAEEKASEPDGYARYEDADLKIAGQGDVSQIAAGEEDQTVPEYEDWGAAIYLSNDDTMSLSSAQRVIYAIDNFLPLPADHIRPHELLNYFSFETESVEQGNDFSVMGAVAPDPREHGIYTLGLSVKGRPVDKTGRRNAVLTLVIDRSGSMRDEGRMNYLKQGLLRMLDELKTGDMVHLVVFDHEVCVPAENFVVGRDDVKKLKRIIKALKPRGSTDLHRGLAKGYQIADKSYQNSYTNRVVIITDALTNTGVTDERMISMISKYYDSRRIRLSGVGVGRNFNDSLLNRLTERGKGAYVFLGSPAEVEAVFGNRFISLIETTALDVHFRLHLPPSLRMNVFYGEESSVVKEDVQEIHYFANTSQLFLSDLMARGGELRPEDWVMLSIEYKDPETEQDLLEEYAFNLGEISNSVKNVEKARVIMAWIDLLAQMASRPFPINYRYGAGPGSLQDADGWQKCQDGSNEMNRLSQNVADDPEVRRVKELWDKFCARFERPRNPVKREIVPPEDSWPGAKPSDRE